ncbi:MAG: phytoene/squalene synthase family protein [Rhodobacteraceae bacterium]|nr:phytoene/squalene synthase family protein [Paracoccaceae bacterium]
MIDPRDMDHCTKAIRHGSRSFHTASMVLPKRVRDPGLALYAFCRLADDAVDLHSDKSGAVLRLRDRLERIYEGRPKDAPADRAFAAVVDQFDMPRALPDALLEGLAWDALERRYETFSDLVSYSARVASAVGVMMSVLMGVRDRHALARAADLGVAMQLTNIARDVGEDAREGRLYLPLEWLTHSGIDSEAFLANPQPIPEIRAIVGRLLKEANRLYVRSEPGVRKLPMDCRFGILAARHVYAGIGTDLAAHGHDSISRRAHTGRTTKLHLMGRAFMKTVGISLMPQSAVLYADPLPEVAFLVEAACVRPERVSSWGDGRSGAFIEALAQLEYQDQHRRRVLYADHLKEAK